MPEAELIPGEEWRPVAGFGSRYTISNMGRIIGVKGLMRPATDNHGYRIICLHHNRAQTMKKMHALVAEAFIGSRPEKADINHKNGVKSDNRAVNLEYISRSENLLHAIAGGKMKTLHPRTNVFRSEQVIAIRASAESCATLAARYGVHHNTIRKIRRRTRWTRV